MKKDKGSEVKAMPYPKDVIVYRDVENLRNFQFIKKIGVVRKYPYEVLYDIGSNKVFRHLTFEDKSTAVIKYLKINPTKYRLRIYGANEAFPIIFGEMYHRGWFAYLTKWKAGAGFEKDMASLEAPGTARSSGFSSRDKFWETWLPNSLQLTCDDFSGENSDCDPQFLKMEPGFNPDVVRLPQVYHWKANGYANSWWIDPEILKNLPKADSKNIGFYNLRQDGGIDMEIIIEFWPQRLFYLGLFVSGVIVIVCLTLLLCSWRLFPSRAQEMN